MQKFAGLKIVLYQILIKISIGTEVILRPNGLAFSCRERAAQTSIKKRATLRAKRSTATPCWTHTLAVGLAHAGIRVTNGVVAEHYELTGA